MDEGTIGWAVQQMKEGHAVQRLGWNGPNQRIKLQVPDGNSKMTLSYVYIITEQNHLVPWLCSQSDLLATDWQVL